jgi:hypothetical protein
MSDSRIKGSYWNTEAVGVSPWSVGRINPAAQNRPAAYSRINSDAFDLHRGGSKQSLASWQILLEQGCRSVTLKNERQSWGSSGSKRDSNSLDYYCIPAESLDLISLTADSAREEIGFIQSDGGSVGYGRCKTGVATNVAGSAEFNGVKDVCRDGKAIELPFDFAEDETSKP